MSELVVDNVYDLVAMQEQAFNSTCVDDKITFAKESQFANQILQSNDFLNKTAWNNQQSLINAVVNVAAIGISLNPAAKHAYLVPRDGRVCLDVSYMGLMHLAMSTGSILWGQCKLVHANDNYKSVGLDRPPAHKYSAFGDRGEVVGGYCTVKTSSGDYLTDEMSIAEIKEIQQISQSRNSKFSPWVKFWNEMARKTIVKRAYKYWPQVDRLDNAVHYLNTDAGEGINTNKEKIELIVNPEESITASLKAQGKSFDDFFEWATKVCKKDVASMDDLTEAELQQFAKKLEATV